MKAALLLVLLAVPVSSAELQEPDWDFQCPAQSEMCAIRKPALLGLLKERSIPPVCRGGHI